MHGIHNLDKAVVPEPISRVVQNLDDMIQGFRWEVGTRHRGYCRTFSASLLALVMDPCQRSDFPYSLTRPHGRSTYSDLAGGEKSDYGVVIYHCAVPIASFSIGLGHYSTVFDAEMFALAHASSKVKKILDAHTAISHVKFYSDSTSSLKVIFEPSAHPAHQCSLLFRTNVIDLLSRMPDLEIDVRWSLGHTDIIGNEAADKAAKAGVRLPSLIFRTHSYAGMSSKMRAQTRWREEWSEEKAKRLLGNTPSGFELADVHPPKISPNEYFRSTPRELFGRLTQTLTNRGYTGDYYRRFAMTGHNYDGPQRTKLMPRLSRCRERERGA